jgi:hypothetical protein
MKVNFVSITPVGTNTLAALDDRGRVWVVQKDRLGNFDADWIKLESPTMPQEG